MNRPHLAFWLLVASSAIAAPNREFSPLSRTESEEPRSVSTEVGTVQEFRRVTQQKLRGWDSRISGLKDKRRLETAGRLESHRDLVRQELKRMSESESPVVNQAAEAAIDRHFREMEQVLSSNKIRN